AHPCAMAPIDQPPDRRMRLQQLLDPVGGGNGFKAPDHMVALARVKKREMAVMAAHRAIEQTGPQPVAPATQPVDHERQCRLIQPRVKALPRQFDRRVVADRPRMVQEQRAKTARAGVVEPARIEIKITPPVIAPPSGVEARLEIEPEALEQRAPDVLAVGPVK